MLEAIFYNLSLADNFFWSYIAFVLIISLGVYFTIQNRFFQIRAFPSIIRIFFHFLAHTNAQKRGVHPLKAFFASVGGMIGIGNVVGIVTAIQIGGPGALFWVWMAALIGTVIKYSEIFLGIKYRVENERGSYSGGPMYFLASAFKSPLIPLFCAFLLCIYGIEIYQFKVITDSLSSNFGLNHYFVLAPLLFLIVYASLGGVPRIGKICSIIMPFFMILYFSMSLWVIIQEIHLLPEILNTVCTSAFTGHAAVGGFAGSTALLAIQHGISRAAYSADLGIGYDSIIQSESNTSHPEKQAKLSILGVCIDNLICTLSIFVVLLSGVWKSDVALEGSHLVQTALSQYFPYMHIFIPLFLLVAGFTTMIAYFCVGITCARFLFPRFGKEMYVGYGVIILLIFSFLDQSHALLIMSLCGALLLILNLLGIYVLRKEVVFQEENYSQNITSLELS